MRHPQNGLHAESWHLHFVRNFFRRRLTAKFLQQFFLRAQQFVDDVNHVHGNTNCPRLIRDGTRNRLSNPPRRVSRKFVTAPVFKFFHRLHQTHVAFLNQIQKRQSAIRIFFRDGNHEAQICFHHFRFRLHRSRRRVAQPVECRQKIRVRHPHKFFQRAQLLLFRLDQMFLCRRFALVLRVRQCAQRVLHFVVDVSGHERNLLVHLLLETKLWKLRLQFFVQLEKFIMLAIAFRILMRVAPQIKMPIHFHIQFPRARHQFLQCLQVRFAIGHLLVQHHAVETFARRIGQKFFRQGQMFLCRKTKTVNNHAQFRLGPFRSFGNFHFLLARQ